MTSKGLGEMFEGDSADMCAEKFPLMLMGDARTVKRAQTVSEDPHWRERNFLTKTTRIRGERSEQIEYKASTVYSLQSWR